jgi:hypothetical protein
MNFPKITLKMSTQAHKEKVLSSTIISTWPQQGTIYLQVSPKIVILITQTCLANISSTTLRFSIVLFQEERLHKSFRMRILLSIEMQLLTVVETPLQHIWLQIRTKIWTILLATWLEIQASTLLTTSYRLNSDPFTTDNFRITSNSLRCLELT